MKRIITFAICLTLFNANALETEKIVKSKPEKIIIYTQGAQVHRTSNVNLVAGQNTIIFSGLENCINASAIQASGNGNFIIADIQHEVYYPEVVKAKINGDVRYKKLIKNVQDSIQELNYYLEDIKLKQDALTTEKSVLLNYSLYKGQNKKDSLLYLKDGLSYLREKLYNINSEQLKLKREKEKLDSKVKLLNDRLYAINNELTNQANTGNDEVETVDYRIIVNIIADQATAASVSLNYYITTAGWTPSYDLRALSNEQNIKLTYKAQIYQQTGIDWNGVKLVLSTANPNRSYAIPILSPWYLGQVSYPSQKNRLENYSSAQAPQSKKSYDNDDKVSETIAYEAKDASSYTTVSENVIETEYEIKLNYTIPSDGKTHFAAILVKDLKTFYRYKAVPKLNNNVYLTAVLPDWEDAITMSGTASIYYDGSYIGNTNLQPGGTEDTIQLSLGIDKNVAVKRTKIKDKCTQKLLDNNDIIHQYAYEITLKNSRSTKIEIDIEDQLPLTYDKNVTIDRKEISGAKYDEMTGILKWRINVQAKDSKKINFVYQVKAPKTMPVAIN